MAKFRLDKKLLDKLASKLGKKRTSINVMVSSLASRIGISSEAALVILARKHGIGTNTYYRKLTASQHAELREHVEPANRAKQAKPTTVTSGKKQLSEKTILRQQLKAALTDDQLQSRCLDLLLAKKHLDRPVSEATKVLETRIRQKSNNTSGLTGTNLVNAVVKADPSNSTLAISRHNGEQEGYSNILRGLMMSFRNRTHHDIIDTFSLEEAISICSFINTLLVIIDGATVRA